MENAPQQTENFKICIIGATGAIGKEIVRTALAEAKVTQITLIIRKKLPEWENDPDNKLRFVELENFDNLEAISDSEHLQGIDAFFCTLGTR